MKIIKNHPKYEVHIEEGDPFPWPLVLESHNKDWEPLVMDTSKIGELSGEEVIEQISSICMVKRETVEKAFNK